MKWRLLGSASAGAGCSGSQHQICNNKWRHVSHVWWWRVQSGKPPTNKLKNQYKRCFLMFSHFLKEGGTRRLASSIKMSNIFKHHLQVWTKESYMFQPDFKCHKTQLSRIKNFFNLSELGTELKLDCLCGGKNVRFVLFWEKLKFTVKIASYISSVHLYFISLQDKFSTATKVNTGA